jgi:hypothetical protein
MMKIYGLLEIKSLFIFDKFKLNFENAVNASYKMSEDGASGIVLKGNFNDCIKIEDYLKGKMDIPVGIFVRKEPQYRNLLEKKVEMILSNNKFQDAQYVIIPKNSTFLLKRNQNILIENARILRIFNETIDFLPEIVSSISTRLAELRYDCFITEEVKSAKKGIKLFNFYRA